MVIAVNTRYLKGNNLEGYGYFTKEILQLLTKQHPQHEFHFFFDEPYNPAFIFSSNVTPHSIPPPARHPLLWKYWYDNKVARKLKKMKADVFLSFDGQCVLTTRVPQCLVIHDVGFLHYPNAYKKSHVWYLKHFTPAFIKKAKAIATVSSFSKLDIVQHYQTNPEKISVVYNGVKEIFSPQTTQQQNAIKEKYTGGAEYFLYVGAIHPRKNLLNLLKAFSVFKRRLHSAMKLVLVGRQAWKNTEFVNLLATYKYKEDVVLTGYVEESVAASFMAAAYALVYPSLFEGFGVPVAEAMRCRVPVLTSKNSAMEEVAKLAGLYFNPHQVNDIADKLMLIYKDEQLRQRMIEEGSEIVKQYTWQQAADKIWNCLQRATQ